MTKPRIIKGELIKAELAGLCLDSDNCFNWNVPADAVPLAQDAIGEQRNFRFDVSGEILYFEGCVVSLDIRPDFSAKAKIKVLTLPHWR